MGLDGRSEGVVAGGLGGLRRVGGISGRVALHYDKDDDHLRRARGNIGSVVEISLERRILK